MNRKTFRPELTLPILAFAALLCFSCSTRPELPAPAPSAIRAASPGFSPTGDPEHRILDLLLSIGEPQAVSAWSVRVVSGSVTVREFAGTGASLPERLSWDGLSDNGKPWPEGEYYAFLGVEYGGAFQPSRGAWTRFFLVSSAPSLSIEASPAFFTPSGLAMAEPVTLRLRAASEYAKPGRWRLEIGSPRGEIVKSYSGEGAEAELVWDGQTFGGAFAEPSKTYTVIARSWDEYGNAASSSLGLPVLAQPNAPEASSIRPLSPGFSPTGDPSRRSMNFALAIGNKAALKSWAVEIAAGSVVLKRIEGAGPNAPAQVSWDGRAESGTVWPEGDYLPILTVDYGQAFNPVRVTGEKFLLVSSPPSLSLTAKPEAFTPRGEGMEGPVAIALAASAPRAKIATWTLGILDARGAAVKSFEGSGPSGSIVWDGLLPSRAYADPGQGFSLRARVKDEYGNAGEATLALAVKPLGEAEASIIATEARGFSPIAGAGQIEFSVKIGSPEALKAWRIDIADAAGRKRSFSGGAADYPTSLSWDGRDEAGNIAPEGAYSASLELDYGRSFKPASTRSKDFLLVSSPPRARLGLSPEAFLPSGGGLAGPLAIQVEAASALARIDSWTIDVKDADGKTVKAFAGAWPANQAVWDGRTLSGGLVPPASVYAASAEIRDEFGNAALASARIPVRDIPTAPEPSLIEARLPGFSPLARGKARSLDFILRAGNLAELRAWRLTISHAERGAQRVYEGSSAEASAPLAWDGRDVSGRLAPDGRYVAILSLDYGTSYKPGTARSSPFVLQSAPPELSLALSRTELVPKEGLLEKPGDFELSASSKYAGIEGWSISVLDAAGRPVASWQGQGERGKASWDGSIAGGGFAEPSSSYTVLAEASDSLGNVGSAQALVAIADLPPVPGDNSIIPARSGFSPNGDGVLDSIDLRLSVANKEALRAWRVSIRDSEEKVRRSFAGDRESLGEVLGWGGGDDSGGPVPEGVYEAELSLDYGSVYKPASAKSRKFVLALSPPTGSIKVSPSSPIPDEDGFVSPALVSVEAKSAYARLASCELRILDARGGTAAAFESPWPLRLVAWDGVASNGRLAEPEASYDVVAAVKDEFGLSARLATSIKVAPLPPPTEPSLVGPSSRGFSPAAGGTMRFDLGFGNRNLIKDWHLDIEREDKTVRMSWGGEEGAFPESFSWDGRLQDGTLAPDGRYLASLSIEYGRAYAPARIEGEPFLLVASPPSGSLSIDPGLFSPDGDGEAETALLSLEGSSRYARLSDYSIDISDPGGNPFQAFSGPWPPAPIAWDGRNAKGELVESAEDYPVIARIRDEFGNVLELKSRIDVDILVLKTPEGYRIRIASIVFKSFTADYTEVPADRAKANLETLSRLAEKLKKYPEYQIRLVGHAVMVNWDDPALGKAEQEKVLLPLSRARAQAIKEALALRGIEGSRMVTEGVGASDQLVPDSDFANRWKNRRVEFFLRKGRYGREGAAGKPRRPRGAGRPAGLDRSRRAPSPSISPGRRGGRVSSRGGRRRPRRTGPPRWSRRRGRRSPSPPSGGV